MWQLECEYMWIGNILTFESAVTPSREQARGIQKTTGRLLAISPPLHMTFRTSISHPVRQ